MLEFWSLTMEQEKKYQWLFSDVEYDNGKIDVHFVLDTTTGLIKKTLQRRTKYNENKEEKVVI